MEEALLVAESRRQQSKRGHGRGAAGKAALSAVAEESVYTDVHAHARVSAGIYEDFVSEVAADYIQDVAGNGDFVQYLSGSAHAMHACTCMFCALCMHVHVHKYVHARMRTHMRMRTARAQHTLWT